MDFASLVVFVKIWICINNCSLVITLFLFLINYIVFNYRITYEQIKLSYFHPNWTTDCERFSLNWIRKYESKSFKRLCTYILKNTLTGYDHSVIEKRTPTNKCSYSDEWKVLSILEKYFYIKTICFFLNLYVLSWIFITDNI